MNKEFLRPRGDATTVLDIADRDGQDDSLFPLDSDVSWFTRDPERRTINFTNQLQTFVFQGTAAFGGTMTFDLSQQAIGDMIHMIGLQITLPHWLDPGIRAALEAGNIVYQDPTQAWTYANGIGRVLVAGAAFQVGDTTIETVDPVAADVIFKLYPDLNTVFGFGRDITGFTNQQELITPPSTSASQPPSGMFDPRRPFTTEKGQIACLFPFFFSRNPNRAAFPLVACKKARVNINLAPFADVVRSCSGSRASCNDSPLGKTFTFVRPDSTTLSVVAPTDPPPFTDVRLVVYSSVLADEPRDPYIRQAFEVMYRELVPFPFSEPLKYAMAKSNSSTDTVSVQLPLEANHPVEEVVWVIRRRAQAANNNWLNYASYTEVQLAANPDLVQQEPVVEASIMIDGKTVVQDSGSWFRDRIARHHKGGYVPYGSYIYGYNFAQVPGSFTPSGTANFSKANSARLNLTVRVPPAAAGADADDAQTWEVFVYTVGINWLRFQNGICGRLFSA